MIDSLDLLAGRRPGDRVVFEPAAGGVHSVRALRRLGAALSGQLHGSGKLLVLIVTGQSVDAIAAYVECLRLGHSVMLADGRLPQGKLHEMCDLFQPDAVVIAEVGADGPRIHSAQYHPGAPIGRSAVLLRRVRNAAPPPSAPLLLLSTSGSLGEFRFVCLTATNVASNASAVAQTLAVGPEDRGALSLSLAHSYGLSILNSHLMAGGAVVLPGTTPSSRAFWPMFDRARCTTFAGVPETYRILEAVGHPLPDLPTLRLATLAGGRMPEARVIRFAEMLAGRGKELAVMYGQTEATARITCHRGDEVLRAPRSAGTAIPGSSVAVTGPDGARCPDAETGEIVLTGPGVMLGYARARPDLDALPDRPPPELRTGDLGHLLHDRLYVTGRSARLAKPLGVRVSLDEVEEVFANHGPAAVVVDGDEVITAYVEHAPANYRPAYRAVLTAYRLPPAALRVTRIDAIPRTVTGKIAYAQLYTTRPGQEGQP
ncbi:AMP-binding protein [Dactylosporangium matsuzakiense]|uniref:AMP-dependent synthetase/ligase domain-containing protein n=1 Tax=Dactylosporangium matsuzakiense TaxID=53360 RepID=A0A9W6KIG4_9ACTN|nr:AMP-binding protein [Dactylosporangium matsuzakiense]GLL02123.1 hypothetical protein GCM10017581_038650 [Dactylosporangium matsuzakiense]